MTEFEDHNHATVRFARSPEEPLHVGDVRTVLYNWLFATQHHGRFILRIDDADELYSEDDIANSMLADLQWLGIVPDAIEFQSQRVAAHSAAAEKLKSAGLLYACYETAEELRSEREQRLSKGLQPVYGRQALKLSSAQKQAQEASGRTAHWRFLLPNYADSPFETRRTEVYWDDLVRGSQTVDLASMSDPVLINDDKTYHSMLRSIVDDIEMTVSHIIRDHTHLISTGTWIALFRALGGTPPEFGHHNLLTPAGGGGALERIDFPSVRLLHEMGYEPMAINSLAVLAGTSLDDVAMHSMDALLEHFMIDRLPGAATEFSLDTLTAINRALEHG